MKLRSGCLGRACLTCREVGDPGLCVEGIFGCAAGDPASRAPAWPPRAALRPCRRKAASPSRRRHRLGPGIPRAVGSWFPAAPSGAGSALGAAFPARRRPRHRAGRVSPRGVCLQVRGPSRGHSPRPLSPSQRFLSFPSVFLPPSTFSGHSPFLKISTTHLSFSGISPRKSVRSRRVLQASGPRLCVADGPRGR